MKDVIHFNGNGIYHSNDNFSLRKEERDILNNIQTITVKNENNSISLDKYIFNNKGLGRVKEYFFNKAKEYSGDVLGISNQLKLTHSWMTLNKKGGKHHTHVHRNALLSVVYYPQIQDGSFEVIVPESNLELHTNLKFDIKKSTIYNQHKISIPLKNNDVVIFPAWILHSGSVNGSDLDKVLIAGNFYVTGKLGLEDEVNELEV
jgi:hypothetical protein